jgi:hypothetical protein
MSTTLKRLTLELALRIALSLAAVPLIFARTAARHERKSGRSGTLGGVAVSFRAEAR